MSFTAPKFTNAGRQLQTRVIAGDTLTFTAIKLGDGTMTTYEIFSGVMPAIDHCREGGHGLRRERQLGRLHGGGGYAKAPQLLLRSFCCSSPVDDLSKNVQWLPPF